MELSKIKHSFKKGAFLFFSTFYDKTYAVLYNKSMKKILLLFITLFTLVGCDKQTTENSQNNTINVNETQEQKEVTHLNLSETAEHFLVKEIDVNRIQNILDEDTSQNAIFLLIAKDDNAGRRMLKFMKSISGSVITEEREVIEYVFIVSDDDELKELNTFNTSSIPSIYVVSNSNIVATYNGDDIHGHSIEETFTQEEYSELCKQYRNELNAYFN